MDQPMTTVNPGSMGSLNPISEAQKRYCSRALMTAVIIGALLIGLGYVSLGKGLILGTLFSIINFILMGSVMPLKVGQNRGKAVLIALGSMAGRMVLLAAPILAALKMETFHLVSTMIGIFSIQIMIMTDYMVSPVVKGAWSRLAGNSRGAQK